MVLLILVFRTISVIHLSEQPPDQRGLDNQGCTVLFAQSYVMYSHVACRLGKQLVDGHYNRRALIVFDGINVHVTT